MRRLTLILSDLYLPGVDRLPATIDLPKLDWLLRFADRLERIPDWRSWLCTELGAVDLAPIPIAQVCARGLLPDQVPGAVWLATPVHLEARLDHVRLADRGLLRLGAEERAAWSAEFARAFGPDYALHDVGERSFLLSGTSAARVASVDPARLLDADIGQALPSVPAAGELRRLGTEIEMWLHGAAVNVARERARKRRVSALWLWGGGVSEASIPPAAPAAREGVFIAGGDPLLVALARTVDLKVSPAPSSFSSLAAGHTRAVIELTPMSGPPAESLTALDANWFSPVHEALNGGQLESFDLIANDRRFRVSARPGWRIWRRRSSWLTQLSRHVA